MWIYFPIRGRKQRVTKSLHANTKSIHCPNVSKALDVQLGIQSVTKHRINTVLGRAASEEAVGSWDRHCDVINDDIFTLCLMTCKRGTCVYPPRWPIRSDSRRWKLYILIPSLQVPAQHLMVLGLGLPCRHKIRHVSFFYDFKQGFVHPANI